MSNQGVKAELAAAVRRMADIIERQSRQIETQQEIIEELHVELQMAETRQTRQAEPEADTAAGEVNTDPDRGWVRVDVAHPIEDGTYPITEIPFHPQNAKPRIGTCFWDSDDCTWVTKDGSNIIAWRNPIKPYQPEEK